MSYLYANNVSFNEKKATEKLIALLCANGWAVCYSKGYTSSAFGYVKKRHSPINATSSVINTNLS